MIIIKCVLVTPQFIQSWFKDVSRFSTHNIIKQTIPYIDDSVSKNEFTRIISCTTFLVLDRYI